MTREFTDLLKRENQLNLLSWMIIISLLVLVGVLVFLLASNVEVKDLWLLRNHFAQVLIPGLLLMVILYMADTHRKLRNRLQQTHDDLESARESLLEAYDRVAFAHEVATMVSDLKRSDVMPSVLQESVRHYDADAAAIVSGDDVEVFASDPIHELGARSAAMSIAVETVRSGEAAELGGSDGSHAIAVPIRIKGSLHSVAVLWRRSREFELEETGNLKLLARVLELGTENKQLVRDLRQQLRGSLGLLTTLIEDRQKEYAGHSANVANLAVATGKRLGVVGEAMEDLKLAGITHDLGMLRVPAKVLGLERPLNALEQAQIETHPDAGAQLARAAGLRPAVQDAIRAHHERVDGSGYPDGLKANRIPLAARIIAVCDSFDAMTHSRPHQEMLSPMEALDELTKLSGRAYDREVVEAFRAIMTEQLEISALAGLAGVPGGTEGIPQPVNY